MSPVLVPPSLESSVVEPLEVKLGPAVVWVLDLTVGVILEEDVHQWEPP